MKGEWSEIPGCVARALRAAALTVSLVAWGSGCAVWPRAHEATPLPELAPLAERAERARGLPFPEPVEVLILPPEAVGPQLARELDRVASAEEIEAQTRLAADLGIVPEGVDLRAEMLRMQSGSVAGFFTPLDQTLFVVSGPDGRLPDTPGFESVVVHELVHALQAAHSSLPDVTLGITDHDDLAFALAAVLEGGATWAMLRDESLQDGLAQRSAEEVAAGFRELIAESKALGTPRWLRESFLRPYALGYALALQRVDEGGRDALDELLAEPPLSSRELLHSEPSRGLVWLPLDPRGVAPDVACRATAANSYGELGIRVALLEAGLANEAEEAGAGSLGWEADRAMRMDCPGGPAVAWLIQLEEEGPGETTLERLRLLALQLGLGMDRAGQRVLLSSGLEPQGRARLLEVEEQRFPDLLAYLEGRPDILERVRRLRRPRIEIHWPLPFPSP